MTDLLGTLIVDSIAPRWKHYAIGSVAVFWLGGAALLLLGWPELAHLGDCSGSAAALCRSEPPGGWRSWVVPATLIVVVIGTASLLHAAAQPLLAYCSGDDWPDLAAVRAWERRRRSAHARRRARLTSMWVERDEAEWGWEARTGSYARWRRYPTGERRAGEARVATTRPGNALAAARQRVYDIFGLDLGICWGPMLAAMPELGRTRVAEGATVVQLRVQQHGLALLTPAWVIVALAAPWPWRTRLAVAAALLVVAVVAIVATRLRMCTAIEGYADLVEDAVLVHRGALYAAAGVGLPGDSELERRAAARLTDWLTATNPAPVAFAWPE
ncbi:hypothetical protein [Dactylosporangium sp. CA-233914]|uniref:hypothetical protein n=1 Tax=Dactylosporangium sp. CA-233914 TaxID=3239934 RepID=UPI003D8EEC65